MERWYAHIFHRPTGRHILTAGTEAEVKESVILSMEYNHFRSEDCETDIYNEDQIPCGQIKKSNFVYLAEILDNKRIVIIGEGLPREGLAGENIVVINGSQYDEQLIRTARRMDPDFIIIKAK